MACGQEEGGETWLWRASPADLRRTDTGRRWEASCGAAARGACLSGREDRTGRGRRGPGASVYRRWIRRRFWRGERRAWCGLFTRGVELGAGGDGDRRAKEVRRLYCGLRIGGETTCMHPRRGERSPVWYLRMPRKESSGRAGVMQMEHPDRQEQEARRCRGDASVDVRCGTGVQREPFRSGVCAEMSWAHFLDLA